MKQKTKFVLTVELEVEHPEELLTDDLLNFLKQATQVHPADCRIKNSSRNEGTARDYDYCKVIDFRPTELIEFKVIE